MWRALEKRTIDMVVSDHSPSPPEMKCRNSGDFFRAWGGISSLQLGLPVMWTKLIGRNHSFEHLVRWMCSGPARLAGLEKHKATIAAGDEARNVVGEPDKSLHRGPKELSQPPKTTPA